MKNNSMGNIIKSLTKTELEVFLFFNRNSGSLFSMTIDEVAEKCFVSNSTITRTAKKMGYSGFTELKYSLSKNSFKDKDLLDFDYSNIRLNDINNSIDLLNKQNFEKLVNVFYNKRVSFFGMGLSSLVCDYIVTQLLILGITVAHLSDPHTALAYVDHMSASKDALFIVSNSGNTKQCVDLAVKSRNKGIKIISLTNSNINNLSKLSDLNYNVIISEDKRVDFDNASRVPMIVFAHKLIDLLIKNSN